MTIKPEVKDEISHIIERYQKMQINAEANYRDTGLCRYYRKMHKYEDVVLYLESAQSFADSASKSSSLEIALNNIRNLVDNFIDLPMYSRVNDIDELINQIKTITK